MWVDYGVSAAFTPVSHAFIDEYMAAANGEYVKTYLMLLRMQGSGEVSLSQLAGRLDQTEKAACRALHYWEKQGLISLTEEDGEIKRLAMLPVTGRKETEPAKTERPEEPVKTLGEQAAPDSEPGSRAGDPAAAAQEKAAGEAKKNRGTANGRRSYSAAQLKSLKEANLEFDQLLFAVEHYVGRPLTANDLDLFAYLYDGLGFPGDTLEYLTEYCVEKWDREGKAKDYRMMRYLEKVALEWHAAGALSLPQAKQQAAAFAEKGSAYTAVARALGLKNRSLTSGEQETVSAWLYDKKYPLELILSACERTISRINKPDFGYAERILLDWQANGVSNVMQMKQYEEARPKPKRRGAKAQAAQEAEPARDADAEMQEIWLLEFGKD